MGKTLSGIILNQGIKKIDDLTKYFDCEISIGKAIGETYKVYASSNYVLLEPVRESVDDPVGTKEGKTLTFMISETVDGYAFGVCNKNILEHSFKSMGGERIEEYGKFSQNKKDDDYSFIIDQINNLTGEDLFDIVTQEPIAEVSIKFNNIKLKYPSIPVEKKPRKTRKKTIEIDVQPPTDLLKSDELYYNLLDLNVDKVLTQLNEIDDQINTHTVAYLFVLSRFHWDTKVRRESKKVLEKFLPELLWIRYVDFWKDSYRNVQGFHDVREYYQHELYDIGEYFLFAYVNRRNFFEHRPMKGMYNTYSSMTGDKDRIQNVFQCHGSYVYKLPDKVKEEKTIRVAKLMGTENLDLLNSIQLLKHLPELQNLRLWWNKLDSIPTSLNELKNLKRLGLHGNMIQEFDSELYLPKLKFLEIYDNKLSEIDFDQFPDLEKISVQTNHGIKFKNIQKEVTIGYGNSIYGVLKP